MKDYFEITITVDTNDGDYNTLVNTISKEDLDKIRPLIAAIKAFVPYITNINDYERVHFHNYPCGEFHPRENWGEKFPKEIYDFDQEVFDIFEELVPCISFHTIESVVVCPVQQQEILL